MLLRLPYDRFDIVRLFTFSQTVTMQSVELGDQTVL